MTDLAAQATAALERRILPSVIARGGAVRVAAARDGVVTLEVTGSAVPGITGLTIIIPAGQQILPLPHGDRYLGFIFAEAGTRQEVEQALTAAYDRLRVVIG